jgi:hypothetical protein
MPNHHVQTMALANIDRCFVHATPMGMNVPECCDPLLPHVHVSSNQTDERTHHACGVALLEYEAFVQEVMRQRDAIQRDSSNGASFAVAAMERGDDGAPLSSVEARIRKIVELRDDGGLSPAEFDQTRQAIVDSI